MKHLLLAFTVTCAMPGVIAPAAPAAIQGRWHWAPDNMWTRNASELWLSIQLDRDDGQNGISIPARDVPALSETGSNGPLHFTLRRDAGSFDFTGELRDGHGSGDFRFTPDQGFVSGMASLGYSGLSTEDVWRFAIFDITRDYASGFRNAGYRLDSDGLVRTKIHGATPAFLQEVKNEGLGQPPLDDLIKMRIHGVTPEFIKQMRDLGYKDLSIDTLVTLRIHGVSPEFVQQMRAAGFQDATLDRLVAFRIHGVSPEFIKSFSDLGYKNLSGDDLVKMRIHGVTTEFVKALSDLGYRNLPVDDLVKLRIHGVTPEYIKQMRDVGYGKEDIDQLVAFRIHGVDADFVHRAESHGFKNLSADDLVDLKIHAGRWMRGA